jgi:hypothetical protein
MKINAIIALSIFGLATTFAQRSNGIAISAGAFLEGGFTASLSYFHPVITKQVYAVAGFSSLYELSTVTDDFNNVYFNHVTQAFVAIRLGDYVFASPKLSYNWYGKYSSPGWGISGGLLLPVEPDVSLGFSISHERVRFDTSLDRHGPATTTSLLLVCNVKFHK